MLITSTTRSLAVRSSRLRPGDVHEQVVVGGVEEDPLRAEADGHQVEPEEGDGHRVGAVTADQVRRERHEGEGEQEAEVAPGQPLAVAAHAAEDAVVHYPELGDDEEGDQVAGQLRAVGVERVPQGPRRIGMLRGARRWRLAPAAAGPAASAQWRRRRRSAPAGARYPGGPRRRPRLPPARAWQMAAGKTVMGAGRARSIPRSLERWCNHCWMQLLAIASQPGTIMRLGGSRWKPARLVFVCCLMLAAVAAGTVLGASSGGAATSGWYVASAPATGGDDIVLGSSCANSVQCMAVGITLNNIGSNGTDTPLVEVWNGSSWTLSAQPPVPTGAGGGLFDVSCISGSDCWAVGAVVGVDGDGNPSAALIENWNGVSWSMVPSPAVTGPGVVGAVLQGVSCVSAASCVAVGFSTDDNGDNLRTVTEQWNGSLWSLVPAAGHRSSLRSAEQRPVSRRRRLLGRGQRRPGPAETRTSSPSTRVRSAIKGSSSTGTALLGR